MEVIDPDEVLKKKADSSGRVTLGSDYSNEEVKVAVEILDED